LIAAQHVVVTRAESKDGPLSCALRELGLPVLLWPAVAVTDLASDELKEALQEVRGFDWIVFASRHAVTAVTRELGTPPEGVHIAAVGSATAQALQERGWPVDLLPPEASAAALVSAFATIPERAGRILYPASSRALPTILAGLSKLGAHVVQVEAYRTESAALDTESCRNWIARGEIGAVTFASPSAVLFLERALGKADFDRLLTSARAVAIGATTAAVLAERGHTAVMAETATFQGLALTTLRTLQTRH
jgi:uroporphyrinogen-III synthase